MSDSNGPVRRRRIAGEAGPAAPAQKAVVKKGAAAKKAAGSKKAPAANRAPAVTNKPAVTSKTPRVAKTPTAQQPAAATAPTVATPASRRPSVSKPVAPKVANRSSSSVADMDSASERRAGSRPSKRELAWLVPATLVSLAALVVGAFLVVNPPGDKPSGSAVDSSQRQASSAAASAAEAIFSFRYDQLDQHLAASKALMTPAFARQFDSIAPALTELAPQRKIVVKAVTRESAALPCGNSCSTKKADVLVFVDQARLVGDDTQPSVFANRIKVSLVKGKSGWLVSNIRAL